MSNHRVNPNEGFYDDPDTGAWLSSLPLFSGELPILLEAKLQRDAVMYDIGCGSGRLYETAVGAGFVYSGCDVSTALLARFRQTHPEADVHRSDARSLPWDAGTGDVGLLTYHVIEAIMGRHNRLATLLEARRVLKSGAALYISHHVASRYRTGQQLLSFVKSLGSEEYGDIAITDTSAAGGLQLSLYRTHIPSWLECRWLARTSGFIVSKRWPFDTSSTRSANHALMEKWIAR